MNIIITGPKHCGKSTIIRKLLDYFPGNVSGFVTEFDDRSSSTRELRIRDISGFPSRCAVRWNNGTFELFSEAFEDFAPQTFDKETDLIIFDELGKFEKDCHNLESSVKKAFESPCPVLAVIRLDAAGWMQELKNRNDVSLIYINETNRDSIPTHLLEMITNYCSNR